METRCRHDGSWSPAGIAPFRARCPLVSVTSRATLVSHTGRHRDLSAFAGRRVAVVGSGQSAFECAALMAEHGAEVEVLSRSSRVVWLRRQSPKNFMGPAGDVIYAPTDVGPAWYSRLVSFPDLFRRLPRYAQTRIAYRAIRPACSNFVRERLDGVGLTLGVSIDLAEGSNSGMQLGLSDGTERQVDHVMFGTGYKVDVAKYPFLDSGILDTLRRVDGYPDPEARIGDLGARFAYGRCPRLLELWAHPALRFRQLVLGPGGERQHRQRHAAPPRGSAAGGGVSINWPTPRGRAEVTPAAAGRGTTRYASQVARAIARDPTEALERVREKRAERHDARLPWTGYRPSPDAEEQLHRALGLPWPCSDRDEFAALWPHLTAPLIERGLDVGRGAFGGWDDGDPALVRAAWCLTRHLQPEVVVETGVARGLTTAAVLRALAANGTGHLWSIDLPPLAESGLSSETAAAVGLAERSRWTPVRRLEPQGSPRPAAGAQSGGSVHPRQHAHQPQRQL